METSETSDVALVAYGDLMASSRRAGASNVGELTTMLNPAGQRDLAKRVRALVRLRVLTHTPAEVFLT